MSISAILRRRRRQQQGLTDLIERGMDLAELLHRRAMAAADNRSAMQLTDAFERVASEVREMIALQAKLEREDLRAEARFRAAAGRRSAVGREPEPEDPAVPPGKLN